MDQNNPQSTGTSTSHSQSHEAETERFNSREICTSTSEVHSKTLSSCPESPLTFELGSRNSYNSDNFVNTATVPLNILPSIITQQQRSSHFDTLPSPASMTGQPQSLFLLASAKLNESLLSLAVMNYFRESLLALPNTTDSIAFKKSELSPPDSLASAPPSYSFVLRQMAARRPRIIGTFKPSPSFVQHTPPPNYAAAFDIYVENALLPPPRVYNFGFTSMSVVCPNCGHAGMSMVHSKITMCTHLCAFVLCMLCCWVCAPLPYLLRSCKDVYHYCRYCRRFLGAYCPSNAHDRTATTFRRLDTQAD